jgi:sporulation protein YlmC with PRC-barrel domain
MADATKFMIGAEVICSDGVCGEIRKVVVDPFARVVTHLVVEPKHRQGLGRLVPLDLVDSTAGDVQIRCTTAEFEKLEHAEETQFLPGSGGHVDYESGQALSQPYYGLADTIGEVPEVMTYDTVPLGEVAIRRGDQVQATDGPIGSVEGLVIDPRSHYVTHVLLQEGHLWGRKEVAIPIIVVIGVGDGIRLSISKQEVEDLPSVDVIHPNH